MDKANVTRRLLAAASVLADQTGVPVPETLSRVTGGPVERANARQTALAEFLEAVVLEQVKPGLAKTLSGYTDIDILRYTPVEDLQAQGVDRRTAEKLARLLGGDIPAADDVLVESDANGKPGE